MIGDEFGMESVAMWIFWSLFFTLVLWLIYTLINSTLNTKSSCRRKKTQEINALGERRGEIKQKELTKK